MQTILQMFPSLQSADGGAASGTLAMACKLSRRHRDRRHGSSRRSTRHCRLARRHRRNGRARASRSPAVGTVPHAGGDRTRHHLDPRRPRGDPGRRGGGRAQAEPGAAAEQYRHRPRQQRLSRRSGAWRAVLRLADRPDRPQEAVLRNPHRLPDCHRGHGLLLEFLELRRVSLPDRGRHRRRVRSHQLHHPGADTGARARLDRSRHQRQLLGGRSHRRRGVHRPARSCIPACRYRLARRVCDRGAAQHGDLRDAHVDSREPTMAGHARPRRGSRGDRGRHRAQPEPAGTRAERRALPAHSPSHALAYAVARGGHRAVQTRSGSARWSA